MLIIFEIYKVNWGFNKCIICGDTSKITSIEVLWECHAIVSVNIIYSVSPLRSIVLRVRELFLMWPHDLMSLGLLSLIWLHNKVSYITVQWVSVCFLCGYDQNSVLELFIQYHSCICMHTIHRWCLPFLVHNISISRAVLPKLFCSDTAQNAFIPERFCLVFSWNKLENKIEF